MMDFPLPCLPAGETPFFSRSNYAEQNARQMSTICLVCALAARPMIVTRTKLHYLGCAYHDTAFHVWIRNHDVVCVCILYACKLDVQHACFACCIVYMYNPHNMFFFFCIPSCKRNRPVRKVEITGKRTTEQPSWEILICLLGGCQRFFWCARLPWHPKR